MNISVLMPAPDEGGHTPSPSRHWIVALFVVVALVALGCGSRDDPQDTEPGLSAHQYQELERLYRVQVRAEAMPNRPAIRAIRRACAAVDRDDALLAASVAGCERMAALALSPADIACDAPSGCARLLRGTAKKIDEVLEITQEGQHTLKKLLGSDGCTEALATPPDMRRALTELTQAFRNMAVGIDTGDDALATKTAHNLSDIQRQLKDMPSARHFLDRFRQRCATAHLPPTLTARLHDRRNGTSRN